MHRTDIIKVIELHATCDKKYNNFAKKRKICYRPLEICYCDKLVKHIIGQNIDIFSYIPIKNNAKLIKELSIKTAQKINSQIALYRCVNNTIFVEFVAKKLSYDILQLSNADINEQLGIKFGYNMFYKKELQILPALISKNLINVLYKLTNMLLDIDRQIIIGGTSFKKRKPNYSDAFVYGVAKYNQNLLKYSDISFKVIKKCTFNLISKLNKIYFYISNCIFYLNQLSTTYYL